MADGGGERYDALVVGAGLSGLAAGIRLAHFERRVLVVERHARVGGLNSWYRRGARELSVGLHAVTHAPPADDPKRGGGALARLCRQLRIGRDELRLAPQRGSAIRFPSATLRFGPDPALLADEVRRAFPGGVDGYARLDAAVAATDETAVDGVRPESARARVWGFVRDPLLADMLMAPPLFYGAPSAGDMDWLAFCVLWKGIYRAGLAIPEGGMRPVLERLVERLREADGELRLGVGVDALLADGGGDGGAVRAARLSDGRIVEVGQVFSSAGREETATLLRDARRGDDAGTDAPAMPDGTADADAPPTVSVVEALVATPGEPAAAGLADSTTFYSFDDALDHGPGRDGLWNARNGVVAIPNNFDLATPPSEGLIRLSALADFDRWRALADDRAVRDRVAYLDAKARAAESLLDAARRLGLDPAASTEVVDVFTPLTLARYTGHARGALYGAVAKDRSGRTPCPNLFLIGADQGFHGIVGAMLSGVTVANRYGLNA